MMAGTAGALLVLAAMLFALSFDRVELLFLFSSEDPSDLAVHRLAVLFQLGPFLLVAQRCIVVDGFHLWAPRFHDRLELCLLRFGKVEPGAQFLQASVSAVRALGFVTLS